MKLKFDIWTWGRTRWTSLVPSPVKVRQFLICSPSGLLSGLLSIASRTIVSISAHRDIHAFPENQKATSVQITSETLKKSAHIFVKYRFWLRRFPAIAYRISIKKYWSNYYSIREASLMMHRSLSLTISEKHQSKWIVIIKIRKSRFKNQKKPTLPEKLPLTIYYLNMSNWKCSTKTCKILSSTF